jgi:DNA-binding GntR family transcriptional regulator
MVNSRSARLADEAQNAQQVAYEYIKEEILSLRLGPGVKLNAIELASRLELSRTPVREALGRLEHEGLASRDVGGGFRVHALSLKEIVDTYKVREALEVEAAMEALPRLTDEVLDGFEKILRGSEAFLAPATYAKFILANRRFHAAIVKASGNAMLEQLMAPIVDRVRLVGAMLIRSRAARQREVLDENLAILAALRTRDPRRIEEAVRAHVRLASRHTSDLLGADHGQLYFAPRG